MRGLPARQGLKSGLFLAISLTGALLLSACSDIDNMFGDDEAVMSDQLAPPDAGAPPTAGAAGTFAPSAYAAPSSGVSGAGMMATITPVTIDPGNDTGTAVNKTIQGLRSQVSGLQQKLVANAQRLADLRNASAGAAGAYQTAKAHITTRLQVGTTKGNPELVSEWNGAQSQLDALTGNINALNTLGTDVANDSSTAHYALNQIGATFNVSGAVDDDHRQLSVLEDETSQTIVLVDRLLKEVSDSVQRQTAYVANERASLTTLAASIKNGELYGGGLGVPAGTLGGALGGSVQTANAGSALVVIKFDRSNVDYQQILYTALNQALQSRPSASFRVVAVSPTKGTAAAVQLAQTSARRHAEDVMRSMTDMGVPATRLAVASTTDPGATANEVRVFAR
jgi:hypothetical protein